MLPWQPKNWAQKVVAMVMYSMYVHICMCVCVCVCVCVLYNDHVMAVIFIIKLV